MRSWSSLFNFPNLMVYGVFNFIPFVQLNLSWFKLLGVLVTKSYVSFMGVFQTYDALSHTVTLFLFETIEMESRIFSKFVLKMHWDGLAAFWISGNIRKSEKNDKVKSHKSVTKSSPFCSIFIIISDRVTLLFQKVWNIASHFYWDVWPTPPPLGHTSVI